MQDLVVGIIILVFIILGAREGLIKSLGSVVLIFLSLFVAAWALNILGQVLPQFSDPGFEGTVIALLLIWIISYLFSDILLTILFKKIINIIVLGPLDIVGGLLVGGLKGLLICGIALHFILAVPFSGELADKFRQASLARFSIAAYEWAYPKIKQLFPAFAKLMKVETIDKIKGMDVSIPQKINTEKYIPPQVKEYQESLRGEGKVEKLLKEQKLLPTVPQSPFNGGKN